jgi:3-isopropylmalate/(R)-2-methylmalate dehydratase large subunit
MPGGWDLSEMLKTGIIALMNIPKTLFEKIWDSHVVAQEPGSRQSCTLTCTWSMKSLPQAFRVTGKGVKVRRPERTFATMDHSTPTPVFPWI